MRSNIHRREGFFSTSNINASSTYGRAKVSHADEPNSATYTNQFCKTGAPILQYTQATFCNIHEPHSATYTSHILQHTRATFCNIHELFFRLNFNGITSSVWSQTRLSFDVRSSKIISIIYFLKENKTRKRNNYFIDYEE